MNEIIKNNSNLSIARTPDLIAAEINNIKEQTRKMVLYNSTEIGRRLIEAKEIVGHGQWGQWLKESVDYSQRTANNLMKIFQEYGSEQITLLEDNSKSQAFANLSYSQAIALLEIPEEEREGFIKENNVEDMSTRELQKVIKEKEQALKEKEDLEKKLKETKEMLEEESDLYKSVSESYTELEKTNLSNKEKAEKFKSELAKIKAKNKEDLVNREVEIENLKMHIEEIKKKLSKAESSGDNEEVEKLQLSLRDSETLVIEANKKIEELEEKLKEKPVDVTETIVEKVPDDIMQELQALRENANKNTEVDKSIVKFSVQFDSLVKGFKEILGTLEEMPNEETKNKYKTAAKGLINKMVEKL